MSASERKKAQLGMPLGTAAGRLRKQLLFKMAKELGLDTCCRCQTLIESVDEFTIDHILPWYNHDVALFWDLDNIAFSHSRCNLQHDHSHTRRPRGKWAPCGSHERYRDGCRCDKCRAWKSADNRRWRKAK